MTNVIKKNGTQEPFNPEKIKNAIKAAGKDAGMDETKQNELAESISSKIETEIQNQSQVSYSDIRRKVLETLDTSAPSVAAAWRKFEETKNQ